MRTSERICLGSPGCIDPDYVQVAEVVTLGVHQTAARTALGPHSVGREAVSSHWESQSWSETSGRSETGANICLQLER